jgi:iron complex outermembrane receptor protein
LLSVAAVAGLFAAAGRAQTVSPTTPAPTATASAPAADSAETLEKFVVTGSYLPISADAPAVPVTTIDAQAIEASGTTTNLLEVLSKVSPVFQGGLNLGPSNGNIASNSTNGGSQASIRNLATLVLINGHRLSFSPVDAVGGYQFVDLNLIPVSAVAKVEVLTDGASAIYGSDAVGGVVNIILKDNYNGFEVGTRYGFSDGLVTGHYSEKSAYLTGGVSNGKTSITISAEWTKTDPLYQYQVSTSRYTVGTTNYPGVINSGSSYYILNPGLAAPPAGHVPIATLVSQGVYSGPYTSSYIVNNFNLSSKPTSLLADERKSFIANFDHHLTDTLTFSGDVFYTQTNTFSQLNAQPVSVKLAATDPTNPTNATFTAHNRFVNYPRQYLTDTNSIQGVGALDGQLNPNWSWEVSGDYNEQRQHFQNPNLVVASALATAESSDALDLFANTQAPGALAASGIFGTAFGEYVTSLTTYDAVLKGKPVTLPAGDLQFALGGEFRREGLSSTADVNSLPGSFNWASGTEISPLTASRNIWGEFAQMVIPIVSPAMKIPGLYSLSMDDAVRHEEYAVVSKKPTVPLLALRYQPFDEHFTLRASYTQSFISPSLYQLYGPSNIGFTNDLTNFKTSTGQVIGNDGQANVQSFSNTGLNPSQAETWTAGFVYSPEGLKGFTIGADYYRIRQSGIIGVPNVNPYIQDIELKGAASVYAKNAALNDFPGTSDSTPITAPGQVSGNPGNVYYNVNEGNVSNDKYEGMDVAIGYNWEWAGIGRFQFTDKVTYDFAYWVQTPGVAPEETAGKASFNNGTIPRYRSYATLTYTRGGAEATIADTFIPSLTDDDDGEHIAYYTAVDLEAGYTFSQSDGGLLSYVKGLKLSVGVNDLFNRQPSNDYDVFSTDNADISTYSPLGRFFYLEASYKF